MIKNIGQYFWRLVKNVTFIVSGFASFAIAAFVDYYTKGENHWIFYVLVIPISFIIGGIKLYLEMDAEILKLKSKIAQFEFSTPKFEIKVKVNEGNLDDPCLTLHQNPEIPDIDRLVSEEKKRLLSDKNLQRSSPFNLAMVTTLPNQNFHKEVEAYLLEFEKYLLKIWECNVNRANEIRLILRNQGSRPATEITLDLLMPPQFKIPEDHQQYNREVSSLEEIVNQVVKPLPPKPFKDLGIFNISLNMPSISSNHPSFEDPGPFYKQGIDGVHVIFKIDKLVQHAPSEELEPFWIWLGDIEEEGTWEIKIKITCAELPEPVNENILLKIINA